MELQQIFDRLWEDYTGKNPAVQKVYDLFVSEGERVVNDHIAFRTFNDPRIGIEILSKPFLGLGYKECGSYRFEEKKLFAKHFEHPDIVDAPRVFISELQMENFSESLQSTLRTAINRIPVGILRSEELVYSGNVWGQPSLEVYNKLKEESEYAAWVYIFGFCANHFTVSVNALKKYESIQKVNALLKMNGFLINDSGGEVKGTPQELLEQSSVKSEIIKIDFTEGKYGIPGCYYEFALRYPDESGKLYSGFIAKSADKIFESTNFYIK